MTIGHKIKNPACMYVVRWPLKAVKHWLEDVRVATRRQPGDNLVVHPIITYFYELLVERCVLVRLDTGSHGQPRGFARHEWSLFP